MTILLILIPLVWILRFKDYKFGFIAVLGGIVVTNTFLSIFLQIFGVFNFWFLLGLQIIFAVVTVILNHSIITKTFQNIKTIKIKSIPWLFIVAISIIALQFYFVHFDYTGKISTLNGIQSVENFKSGHPYFSDEWIAIGMSEQSIQNRGLPFTNIFNGNNFSNFLFVFHSMISGIDLILGLNLLTAYQTIAIFFALLLIISIYILLRELKVSVGISILTIFLVSYLPNSSNLPILWYLLPWNVGFLFFIIYLISIKKEYFKTSIIFNLFSIIFYPPIVLIALPSFLLSLFKISEKKKRIRGAVVYMGIIFVGLIVGGIFISFANKVSVTEIFRIISDFLARDLDSSLGHPPLFIVWRVIPWFLVPFVFWSLWKIRHKEAFISVPIFIGLVLWFLYSVKFQTIFMDYHRIVAVTAILLVVISAISLEEFKNYILIKIKRLDNDVVKYAFIFGILILFFILSFSFTKRENWMNFTTLGFMPAPPANNYLNKDDIELFKDIHNKRFLAVPWKGLILGVLTDNIPLVTKPSTLTVNVVRYEEFLAGDCQKKKELATKFKIDYVYTPQFSCDGFKFLGKSTENFHLYLVK